MAFDGSYNFNPRPFEGDLSRYGMGPAHKWFDFYAEDEDAEETAPPEEEPGDPTVGQTSLNGGPDGGSHNDARGSGQGQQNYSNFGDWARATMQGLSMLGPFGFAKSVIGQDMAVRDALDSINSMNIAGGALNPELAGRSDPSQTGGGGVDPNGGMGGQTEGGFSGSGVEGEGGFMRDGGTYRGSALPPPRYIRGPGDGRSDSVYANGGKVRLSRNEFVWPADVVSAVGRGSSEAGGEKLGAMAQMIRKQHMNRMGALPPPRA
jgi:hypothetical protein